MVQFYTINGTHRQSLVLVGCQVAVEATMSIFHRVDEKRAKLVPPIEDRLTLGQSAAVIAGLSALSWALLIAIVLALYAFL
jgi:hypothetical protein